MMLEDDTTSMNREQCTRRSYIPEAGWWSGTSLRDWSFSVVAVCGPDAPSWISCISLEDDRTSMIEGNAPEGRMFP